MLKRLPVFVSLLATVLVAPAAASAALPATVQIGAAWSTTGAGAPYATSQDRGARLAVEAANASGALGATKLAYTSQDDLSTGPGAVAAFGTLIDGGAQALLGPTLSGSALVGDPVPQARKVPVLGVSNTVDGITDIGEYVFRDSLPESAVQPQTVKVAKKRFGLRRVAVVWATPDTYSSASNRIFVTALKANHVKVTSDRSFASGNAAALANALAAAARTKPDALVISALQADAVDAMIAARKLPALKKIPFIGGNALNATGLSKLTHGAAEGAVSGTAWVLSRKTPGNAAFVKAYRARFGASPDQFSAQAYAGVQLYVEALKRAGSADGPALRTALAGIRKLPTVLGTFSFDRYRNPVYAAAVVVLKGGRQVEIS